MSHCHLTVEEPEIIALMSLSCTQAEIADRPSLWVSPETLYTWIRQNKRAGGYWCSCLRQGHKKNKRRSRGQPDGRKTSPTGPGSTTGRRKLTPAAGGRLGGGYPFGPGQKACGRQPHRT